MNQQNFFVSLLLLVIVATSCTSTVTAFVAPLPTRFSATTTTTKPLRMIGDGTHLVDSITTASSLSASAHMSQLNNFLVATIDSDIANVPENEFAPIFAGGIMVMFGGLLSALIVGFILESRDLYANVVADSYAQGAEDEEFWKGLSEEEQKKTRELIQKLKESKGESEAPSTPAEAPVAAATSDVASKELTSVPVASTETTQKVEEGKDAGMFSDY